MCVPVLLLFGVGCADSDTDAGAPSTTSGAGATPSESPSDSASPTEPATSATAEPTRYRPHPAEADGVAKRVAARAVEALPEVRQVTYTQYFGYLPPQASILVEADFVDGVDGRGGTTYDVRVSRASGDWQVDTVTAADPPRALADPSPLVRRVLRNDRIVLPWAGRADVAAGDVDDEVLRSMLALAEEHEIGVSVLISAHPVNVFGTDRRSRHPDGFAYDIGSIDGRLVVDPDAAGLVREVMELATGTGADQVGGPTDLDGGGSQYFSDVTHTDHVHVGFDG